MPHRGFGCPTLLPGRSGIQLPGGFLKRCSFRNTLVKSLPNSVKVKHLGAAQKEMTTSPSPQQPGVTTTGTVAELPWGLGTTWKISKPYGSSFEETGLIRRCKATSEEIREPQLGTMSYLKRHPYSGQQGSLIQGISFKPSKGIICVTSLDGHSPGKYICVWSLAAKAVALSSCGVPGAYLSVTVHSLPWLCLLTESSALEGQVH